METPLHQPGCHPPLVCCCLPEGSCGPGVLGTAPDPAQLRLRILPSYGSCSCPVTAMCFFWAVEVCSQPSGGGWELLAPPVAALRALVGHCFYFFNGVQPCCLGEALPLRKPELARKASLFHGCSRNACPGSSGGDGGQGQPCWASGSREPLPAALWAALRLSSCAFVTQKSPRLQGFVRQIPPAAAEARLPPGTGSGRLCGSGLGDPAQSIPSPGRRGDLHVHRARVGSAL